MNPAVNVSLAAIQLCQPSKSVSTTQIRKTYATYQSSQDPPTLANFYDFNHIKSCEQESYQLVSYQRLP